MTRPDDAIKNAGNRVQWYIAELEAKLAEAGRLEAVEARLKDEERDHKRTIIQRENYRAVADILAERISKYFDHSIGEHSNINNPWQNAIDVIDKAIAQREGKESD